MSLAQIEEYLKQLPQDLALGVVLSALSLKSERIERAVELAVGLHALRTVEEEDQKNAKETAERIVEDIMVEFRAKLNKKAEAKKENK